MYGPPQWLTFQMSPSKAKEPCPFFQHSSFSFSTYTPKFSPQLHANVWCQQWVLCIMSWLHKLGQGLSAIVISCQAHRSSILTLTACQPWSMSRMISIKSHCESICRLHQGVVLALPEGSRQNAAKMAICDCVRGEAALAVRGIYGCPITVSPDATPTPITPCIGIRCSSGLVSKGIKHEFCLSDSVLGGTWLIMLFAMDAVGTKSYKMGWKMAPSTP